MQPPCLGGRASSGLATAGIMFPTRWAATIETHDCGIGFRLSHYSWTPLRFSWLTGDDMKALTRDQIQARKEQAARFTETVLGDPERAREIAAESLEDYAQGRKIQITNPERRLAMARRKTVEDYRQEIADLKDENADLQDENEGLQQQ